MKRIMKCEIEKLIKKDFSYLFIYLFIIDYLCIICSYVFSVN